MLDNVWFLEKEVMVRPGAKGPYLFGNQLTLADIALYPWFEQVDALEHLSQFRLPPGCIGPSEWRRAVSGRKAVHHCVVRGALSQLSCRLILRIFSHSAARARTDHRLRASERVGDAASSKFALGQSPAPPAKGGPALCEF